MSAAAPALKLSLRHDSWIRQQIRDAVLHLDAPLETAELLQVALIALAHAAVHFDWDPLAPQAAREAALLAVIRERVRRDLIDEVRQMTHLSRLQRRRWTLVKLAHAHLLQRFQREGASREPTPEELSVLTGLSVTEIDVLQRLARLGPWEPDQGSQQLMELRSLKPVEPSQLQQVRADTRAVFDEVARALSSLPGDTLRCLQRHFGLALWAEGRRLIPGDAVDSPGWLQRLRSRLQSTRFDRRPLHTAAPQDATGLEELLPQRLALLLRRA